MFSVEQTFNILGGFVFQNRIISSMGPREGTQSPTYMTLINLSLVAMRPSNFQIDFKTYSLTHSLTHSQERLPTRFQQK